VDVGPTIHSISHDLADINWVGTGATVSIATGPGGRARRSGAADAGATCSRSMTATSTASSSTWTRNTRARTPPDTRGSSRGCDGASRVWPCGGGGGTCGCVTRPPLGPAPGSAAAHGAHR
jgi:hypothetical protein